MSKAEEFIREHIRNCSNIMDGYYPNGKQAYFPWLTPDQARRAVEIAREEMIEKFYDWLRNNATYIHPRKGTEECITTLGKLREALKNE